MRRDDAGENMVAVCVSYNRARGYGFATPANNFGQPDENQDDVFIHVSKISNKKSLKPGDIVTYEMGERCGRPVAVNVFVLPAAPVIGGQRE
jgi:cold shock CspA family protein